MSLIEKIDKNRLPRHVAIIMDGNGRWAKAKGKDRIPRKRFAGLWWSFIVGIILRGCF